MTNKLNEKRSNLLIVVALVSALVFTVCGLVAGLAAGLSKKSRDGADNARTKMSHYLLIDAADGLRHSASALRLCNDDETATKTANSALVYAVRAETALECDDGLWCDCRASEGFLNDAATLLSSADAESAARFSDELYRLSCEFYRHVTDGEPFDYDGMQALPGGGAAGKSDGKSDANKSGGTATDGDAKKLVEGALGSQDLEVVGVYDGVTELASENCYATVKNGKIREFAFSAGGIEADGDGAERVAESIVKKCGFDELEVYGVSRTDGVTTVKLCSSQGGAYCRDECATVVIANGKVRAFSAGRCGTKHDVPTAKVDESVARRATPEKFASSRQGEGRLVTTFDGKRDRVCYEYRYELDDGEHYVYVCAENGKQMQVR